MNKIHIALAFCDPKGTYCQHAAVTIASVFANTNTPVCVHILHDETLTDENRAKLEELAKNFKQEIDFINVDPYLDEDKIDVSKLSPDGHKGTVFRLLLPELSAEDKMIYLDCDIVVTLDIAELWNVDLNDKSVGVVPDSYSLDLVEGKQGWKEKRLHVWDMLGIKYGEYFNAGVMIINLQKLRKQYNFLKCVEKFYAKYGKCITFADQDCLNCIFSEDKVLLPEKFNHIRYKEIMETDVHNSIWHMAGGKPWQEFLRPQIDELYWKYLRKTPYCNNEEELIENMLRTLGNSKLIHRHSSDCVNNIKEHIKSEFKTAHIFADLHALLLRFRRNKSD